MLKIKRGGKFSWMLQQGKKKPFLGGKVCVPKARIKAFTELFTNEILSFPSSSPIVWILARTHYMLRQILIIMGLKQGTRTILKS